MFYWLQKILCLAEAVKFKRQKTICFEYNVIKYRVIVEYLSDVNDHVL